MFGPNSGVCFTFGCWMSIRKCGCLATFKAARGRRSLRRWAGQARHSCSS
jgi:hypothetical protein